MLGRLGRVLLALALLAAWQAALLHPLKHADQYGVLVHAGDRSGSGTDLSCDKLAALTACVPDAPVVLSAAAVETGIAQVRPGAARAAEAPPFLSQGPPPRLLKS